MRYIYQLVCKTHNTNDEFIIGTYADETKANEQKDIVEKQAIENNIYDLEYQVVKHRVIE